LHAFVCGEILVPTTKQEELRVHAMSETRGTEPVGALEAGKEGSHTTLGLSRRTLLRGAAIAAPTILTVNSASATIAMSSVRTYTSSELPQANGQYYCLADSSTLGPPMNNPNALQVNSLSMPAVQQYQDRDFRVTSVTGAAVTEHDMCRLSGTTGTNYYVQVNGVTQTVNVKKGILMSASAMTSLAVTAVKIDNF
jgi:hypothetical protein